MCSGRVTAEPTTTADAPARRGRANLLRRPVAALREDRRAERGEGADEREVGLLGHRAAGVAGEGRAEHVAPGGERRAAFLDRREMSAMARRPRRMGRLGQRRDGHRAGAVRRVEGDDVGARLGEGADVGEGRGDDDGMARLRPLDQADDRNVGRGADCGDIAHALDPKAAGAAVDGGERKADDEVGAVHRAARDRLARHHETAAEPIDRVHSVRLPVRERRLPLSIPVRNQFQREIQNAWKSAEIRCENLHNWY